MRPSGVWSLCESSTARWLARSTPRWRYVRLPSGASSTRSTNSSVSGAVLCTNNVEVIGPAMAVSVGTGSLRYVNSSGPAAVVTGGPTSPPAWYDQNWRFVPVTYGCDGSGAVGAAVVREPSPWRYQSVQSVSGSGNVLASLRPFGTSTSFSVCVSSSSCVSLCVSNRTLTDERACLRLPNPPFKPRTQWSSHDLRSLRMSGTP